MPQFRNAVFAALVLAGTAHAECSWDKPGANPFMGNVPEAVHDYKDIPPAVRFRLQARMQERKYDEIVAIRRDKIDGYTDLRDMHFGSSNKLCKTPSRTKWKPDAVERGLVYCEAGHCVIVPTVCRNVSRVTKTPMPVFRIDETLDLYKVPELPPMAATAAPQDFTFSAPIAKFADGSAMEAWTPRPVQAHGVPWVPITRDAIAIPVPEPSSWALMAIGLLTLVYFGRRVQS